MRKLKKWIGELCFRVNHWKMKADDLDIGSWERSLRKIWYTGFWVILIYGDTMKTLIDSQKMSNQIIFKDTDFSNEHNSLEHYPRSSKETRVERF